jgi:hypothetical protein
MLGERKKKEKSGRHQEDAKRRRWGHSPDKDEEHRVAGLTRKTDWGEQWTTRMSSGEKA